MAAKSRPWRRAAALLVALSCAAGCPDRPVAPAPAEPSASARPVRIDSDPAGATAVLTGGARCTTPCTLRLEPGLYRVAVRKSGYLPFEGDLAVGPTGEASFSASLVASH